MRKWEIGNKEMKKIMNWKWLSFDLQDLKRLIDKLSR